MLRLTIHTTISSKTGFSSNVWFPFEIDAPDIEAVYARLVRDGAIFGHRIKTENVQSTRGHQQSVATDRIPYIISASGIATIGPCHIDYAYQSEGV